MRPLPDHGRFRTRSLPMVEHRAFVPPDGVLHLDFVGKALEFLALWSHDLGLRLALFGGGIGRAISERLDPGFDRRWIAFPHVATVAASSRRRYGSEVSASEGGGG